MPAPSPPCAPRTLHQQYTRQAPTSPYRLLKAQPPPLPSSAEAADLLRSAGKRLRAADVQAVYLMHGTFAGDDLLGLARMMQGPLPAAAAWLRRLGKAAVDRLLGDCGNFTQAFAKHLEAGLNAGEHGKAEGHAIAVQRLHWCGENHHLGRFDAALNLIEHLARQPLQAGSRVMLWGHSHAGNVFALASQLLYGEADVAAALLDACEVLLRRQRCSDPRDGGRRSISRVQLMKQLLASRPLADVTLDFVTFGTPIRYAWSERLPGRLLHVVYHRPRRGLPEYRTCFPPTWEEVDRAADGDYVQQIGIAGTNTPLNPLAWRTALADRRLGRLLQPDLKPWDIFRRLRCGMRVAQSGTSLLVDYGQLPGNMFQHLGGHAIYTREAWLPFHAQLVTRELYGS